MHDSCHVRRDPFVQVMNITAWVQVALTFWDPAFTEAALRLSPSARLSLYTLSLGQAAWHI